MSRLIGLSLILTSFLGGWFWMDYRETVDQPIGIPAETVFEIRKGQGLGAITDSLQQQGLLQKPHWFKLLVYTERVPTKLKYGEYEIPPQTTLRQLVSMFVAGKVKRYAVTFIEGWGFRQIMALLAQQPALLRTLDTKSEDEIMTLIGAPGTSPEGLFYPDTYFFTRGTTDIELLKRAHRKMQTVLDNEWQGRAQDLPLISPYQALILASIIEKETGRSEERSQIAGVFVRRLQKGMRLQTDPTVIYGMGEHYQGDIHREDLLRDTPFNTYLHSGLPPTPIAMPGAESIRAALHPEPGSSLFFVSRGDGSHIFTDNLEDHRKAVDLYQLNRHE